MQNILQQPKRGEVQRWMIWVMCLAIVGLSAGMVGQYYDMKAERLQMEAAHALEKAYFRQQVKEFQADAKAANLAFSKYLVWQDSVTKGHQRQIERIKKGR